MFLKPKGPGFNCKLTVILNRLGKTMFNTKSCASISLSVDTGVVGLPYKSQTQYPLIEIGIYILSLDMALTLSSLDLYIDHNGHILIEYHRL